MRTLTKLTLALLPGLQLIMASDADREFPETNTILDNFFREIATLSKSHIFKWRKVSGYQCRTGIIVLEKIYSISRWGKGGHLRCYRKLYGHFWGEAGVVVKSQCSMYTSFIEMSAKWI